MILIRIFSVASMALVPILVAAVVFYFNLISIAKQEAAVNAEREARIIANQETLVFEGIRNILIGVSQFTEVKNANARDCNEEMSILLNHINTPTKQFMNIGVLDFKGNLFCGALPFSGNVYAGDRDYFKRTVASRDFSFGNYQVGRVTGQPTMNFGYPVIDETGSVRFVIFVALDLDALNETIGKAKIPGGSTLTITDEDDAVLVRYPRVEGLLGTAWGKDVLSDVHGEEGFKEGLDVDGVPRVFGFSRIYSPSGLNHLHVIVGTPLSEALSLPSFDTPLWAGIFLALLAGAGSFGWFLSGRIIRHLSNDEA